MNRSDEVVGEILPESQHLTTEELRFDDDHHDHDEDDDHEDEDDKHDDDGRRNSGVRESTFVDRITTN